MRYAFKMFNKDLTCTRGRGKYQYEMDKWYEEEEANCARNGFHCAENPLDCLTYYPDWDNSICCLVQIGGDVDEDAHDTKISCTKMRLVKQLTQEQFISQAITYMIQNPEAPDNSLVGIDTAKKGRYPFIFARGKDPKASGGMGDTLVLLKEQPGSRMIMVAGAYEVDGHVYRPGKYYDAYGVEQA